MDFSKPEEPEGSKDQWVRKTHEALDEVEELRQEIPPEYVRTRPYDPPEVVDYYNRLVMKFARRIRPKKRALGAHLVEEQGDDFEESLWTQQVAEVSVPPKEAEVHVGTANIHGEIDVGDALAGVQWGSKPVRLNNLQWWNQRESVVTATYRVPGVGEQSTTIRKSIYLPVFALDAVVNQLNTCIEDLGWLPDAAEKEIESEVLR